MEGYIFERVRFARVRRSYVFDRVWSAFQGKSLEPRSGIDDSSTTGIAIACLVSAQTRVQLLVTLGVHPTRVSWR